MVYTAWPTVALRLLFICMTPLRALFTAGSKICCLEALGGEHWYLVIWGWTTSWISQTLHCRIVDCTLSFNP